MQTHPLEHDQQQREYFARLLANTNGGAAAYRRAIRALTGDLPTWAQPRKPGRKKQLLHEQ